MNRKLTLMVSALACSLPLCACGGGHKAPSSSSSSSSLSAHTHTYASDWTYDENCHWHASTCGHDDEVERKAKHTYEDEVIAPTYEEKGLYASYLHRLRL